MSRPSLERTPSHTFTVHGPHLPEEALQRLFQLLGFDIQNPSRDWTDEHNKIQWDIQDYLGLYFELERNREPSAAEYRRKIQKLGREALSFLGNLSKLDSWTREKLFPDMQEIHEVEAKVATLVDRSAAAINALGNKESRGRPSSPLEQVVLHLQGLFRAHYRPKEAPTSTTKKGAVKAMTQPEKDELSFIEAALLAGQIPCPEQETLRRYLRRAS